MSPRHPAVAEALRLHRARGRDAAQATLLEGPHLVAAAVAAGVALGTVFVVADDAAGRDLAVRGRGDAVVVDEATLRRLGTTETPQSPVAVISVPPPAVSVGGRVIVAWGVADPGNCGTLIRIAAAFGYGFLAGPQCAEPWSPKVLRSAAGAHFALSVGRIAAVDEARAGGRILVATVVRGGAAPGPLPDAAAILVGNEAHGLPDDVVAAADRWVTIPTNGRVESLNAAVAGAIVAYLGATGPGTNLPLP